VQTGVGVWRQLDSARIATESQKWAGPARTASRNTAAVVALEHPVEGEVRTVVLRFPPWFFKSLQKANLYHVYIPQTIVRDRG